MRVIGNRRRGEEERPISSSPFFFSLPSALPHRSLRLCGERASNISYFIAQSAQLNL